jgi:anti-anti-sigma factor
MPASPTRHRIQWDDVAGVTVVWFTIPSIRTEEDIYAIFDELDRLIEQGRTRLVLDFAAVKDFASLTIGKLLALNKKLQPPTGRLVLCHLTPVVNEIITIMGLNRHFLIYRTQEEALQSF